MSIVSSCNEGWVVSHEDYVSKAYKGKYHLRPSLFNISNPFKMKKKKSSKYKIDPLAQDLKNKLLTVLNSIGCDFSQLSSFKTLPPKTINDNIDAIKTAEECTKNTAVLQNLKNVSGGNLSSNIVSHNINCCDVIFPEMCRFICGDIKSALPKVLDNDFNLVILDPPWWNKYIRRKKAKNPEGSYEMLYNEEIAKLPIAKLMSPKAIVAVWCTNCTTHELAIKNEMFPSWGVTYVATWFWIKITTSGEPICPFTKTNGKQPYERVLLGIKDRELSEFVPPDGKVFASVPSALHSHKPPLNDLLTPYLPDASPKCLELFARYLLPQTTSVGLEPLRWQHLSLYISNASNIDVITKTDIGISQEDSHQDS